MRRLARPLSLALASCAAAGAVAAAPRPAAAAPAEGPSETEAVAGAPAPGFTLPRIDAGAPTPARIGLDAWTGEAPDDPDARLVLLTFFASWCEPCQREMPLLARLDADYRARGLRVLAVDIDRDEAGIAAAKALLAKHQVRYPVVVDRYNLLARRYLGDRAPLPSVFLVRRDGTIARVERGYAKDAATFLVQAVREELGIAAGPARGKPSP